MRIFVTGANGGIGQAVTEYLVEKGISVYACDLKEKNWDNPLITPIACDITDEKQLLELVNRFQAQGVKFDAIINIAGIFLIDSFIEIGLEQLKKIFDVNLMGTIAVNKILYPLLNKDGRIIITTSEVAPLDPLPFNGIYSVSKKALDAYSQALRQELNLLGQKVITIRPGAFNTSLSQGSLEQTKQLTDKTELYKKQSHKFYRLVKGFMGKPLSPEKIAKTYYKALTKSRPKFIYKKHTNYLLKLLDFLPKRLQCFVVKALLK